MTKKTITIKEVKVYAPKDKKYNPKDLKIGIKIEGEHTPNKKLRTVIAKNHLDEDPKYYTKLQKMEKSRKK